jgi:hypothetical protein
VICNRSLEMKDHIKSSGISVNADMGAASGLTIEAAACIPDLMTGGEGS